MFNFMQLLELAGGLGLFLYGMRVMSDNIQRRAGSRMQHILSIFTTNRFAGVLTGLGITSIIQSSSATTVLLVSIVNAGLMGLEQAIGVIMGENIGTTITAYLASLGMNVNAKRSARAHMLFNLIGVTWMFIFFFPAIDAVDWLIPGLSSDPHNIPIHLSAFHTAFNLVNTVLLVGFVGKIASFARKLVPDPMNPKSRTWPTFTHKPQKTWMPTSSVPRPSWVACRKWSATCLRG